MGDCAILEQCSRHLVSFYKEGESRGYADDATWIMTSSFVIFTMQTGFGMLEMGCCQPGFEINILLKNVVDVVFGSVAYYLLGYGISFGVPSSPWSGLGTFVPTGGAIEATASGLLFSQYLFQLSFAATATTIVSGCVAMRLKFFIYCLYSFYGVITYSFVAHWAWSEDGWLATLGFHDFAGGAVVHLFSAVSGLVATIMLGPRYGRFDTSLRNPNDFRPSSPNSMLFGLFMLWWGWLGFNCGSTFGVTDDRWITATRVAITTMNSSAAGGLVGIILSLTRSKGALVTPDELINGILGSLVAITPCCDTIHTHSAFVVGAFGAFAAIWGNKYLESVGVDDPAGAIGVHGISAAWGIIALCLFADASLPAGSGKNGLLFGGGFDMIGIHILGMVAIALWAVLQAGVFFYLVGVISTRDLNDFRSGIRVPLFEEIVGADWFVHGVSSPMTLLGLQKYAKITSKSREEIETEIKALKRCSPTASSPMNLESFGDEQEELSLISLLNQHPL